MSVASDQVLLDVQTSEASVRSAGKNEFGVAFDPQSGDTTVAAYRGAVEVYSMGSGLQLAALGRGEQVTVSRGQVSEVTGTARTGGSSSTLLIVGGCLAGLAVLVALVYSGAGRSRKKRIAAGPAAAAPGPVPSAPSPSAGSWLVVVTGKANVGAADLSRGPVTIGRHPSNTLAVQDALVSGQHAQVSLEDRSWVLTDVGSRNGTFLNGVCVQRQALRPGDRIQVGETVIVFKVGP